MTARVKRFHFTARGKVQGVFFRKNTAKKASELRLRGFVQNEDDKRAVTGCVEGLEAQLDEFRQWLHRGPRRAKVEDVKFEETLGKLLHGIDGFVVLRGEERRWK